MYNPFVGDSSEETDEQLAVHGQAGSRDALERLALRYQPWIYNTAVRMVWSPDDAEDLTQDILIKMISGLHTFRGDSRFRTWVYRIAVHIQEAARRPARGDISGLCARPRSDTRYGTA